MKVRCIQTNKSNSDNWTLGKVYEMNEDVGIITDGGIRMNAFLHYSSKRGTLLERWNKFSSVTIFEIINEEEETEMKQFTKDDLKTGMVVELRKGNLALVVGDDLMYENISQGLNLNSYHSNLSYSHRNRSEYDIVKIYDISSANSFMYCFNKLYMGRLLWERQPENKNDKLIEKAQSELNELLLRAEEIKNILNDLKG